MSNSFVELWRPLRAQVGRVVLKIAIHRGDQLANGSGQSPACIAAAWPKLRRRRTTFTAAIDVRELS